MNNRDQDLDLVERNLTILLRRARLLSGDAATAIHPDLETPAYGLLIRIEEVGPVRVSDLATYFGTGKPTMSRQINMLESLALVERSNNPDDARSHLIALTKAGRVRLRAVRKERRQGFRKALDEWNEDELANLCAGLQKLNETVFRQE